MKKKIFGGALLLAIAATAAFNLNFNMNENNKLSSLALANIEALAQNEVTGITTRNCVPEGDFIADEKRSSSYTICAKGTKSNHYYNCPTSDRRGYSGAFVEYECIVKK